MKKSYKPYRNKFEKSIGDHLFSLKTKDFGYEAVKLDYTVSGKYLVDFVLIKKDGSPMYIEAKGNGLSFDGHAKRKMRAVKEQHPDIDIRMLFYSDGKCGPKRKDGTFMRQSDWAEKYGFPYAIKEIPEEWLAE